jgi:hypothetical protein
VAVTQTAGKERTMWLSKDERRLLAGYYTQLRDIGTEKVYHVLSLCDLLARCGHNRPIPEYGDIEEDTGATKDPEDFKRKLKSYIDCAARIQIANKLLAERGLIKITPHQHATDVVGISLTLDGYDLGRRYASFLERSGLFFQEYKNHWVWLIVAFIGGALGVKLIDFFISWIR